jgi:hypothetical protein
MAFERSVSARSIAVDLNVMHDSSPAARKHGGQRWGLGYDLEGLVREYGVLRHCISQIAMDAGVTITLEEFETLAKCLNVGVAEATTAYATHKDQELQAQKAELAFLAEAGQVLASSLDYQTTLTRLTRLIVPLLADWCVVYVNDARAPEQMPVTQVEHDHVPLLLLTVVPGGGTAGRAGGPPTEWPTCCERENRRSSNKSANPIWRASLRAQARGIFYGSSIPAPGWSSR